MNRGGLSRTALARVGWRLVLTGVIVVNAATAAACGEGLFEGRRGRRCDGPGGVCADLWAADLGGADGAVAPICGDGKQNGQEACDGEDLAGQSCRTRGFFAGELACVGCAFDTSACHNCGNGTVDSGESCDGPDKEEVSCSSFPLPGGAYEGGELGCSSACGFDLSGCGWALAFDASHARGVATDGADNIYVVGTFTGTASFAGRTLWARGSEDTFVARLDPVGQLVWVVQAGGTGAATSGSAVAVDRAGNAVISGTFSGSASFGSAALTAGGATDGFVARFNPRGGFRWAIPIGGSGQDAAHSVAIDNVGDILVSGEFETSAQLGAQRLETKQGERDFYVAGLARDGRIAWAVQSQDSGAAYPTYLAAYGVGNALLAGLFTSTITFGSTNLHVSYNSADAFVASIDPSGAVPWVARADGTWTDASVQVGSIAASGDGASAITGWFSGSAAFGSTTFSSASGVRDLFVARLDPRGAYSWAARARGSTYTRGNAVALDAAGNTYVAGYLKGTATLGASDLTSAGSGDALVARLDRSGSFAWSTRGGGAGADEGTGIALDGKGNLVVVGDFSGQASFGGVPLDAGSASGVFIWKITDTTPPVTTPAPPPGTYAAPVSLTFSANEPAATTYCLGSGCTPNKVYSSSAVPLVLGVSTTVRFFSTDRVGNQEPVRSATYTIACSAPGCPHGTWVTVQPGSFKMGSPPSETCHKGQEVLRTVTLTHRFEMQSTEVTQGQYHQIRRENPSMFKQCGKDCPVDSVSWHEAAAYCNELSQTLGLWQCYTCSGNGSLVRCSETPGYSGQDIYTCPGFRLPTEAEWEYAYRAGTQTAYYNGDISTCLFADKNADAIGWYRFNASASYTGCHSQVCSGCPTCIGTQPVSKKAPNAWGLYDLAGNVAEWCHDGSQSTPTSSPVTNPVGGSSTVRALRGGQFDSGPGKLRAASREEVFPTSRTAGQGFRCVRSY